MRQIAIFKPHLIHYYEDYTALIESITEWSEVTDEEYKLLQQWVAKYDYTMIERVDKKPDFLPKTIAAAIAEAKALDDALKKQKEEAERKRQERALKKLAKDKRQKEELYARLKAELEGNQ
jgi:hypothetical protein